MLTTYAVHVRSADCVTFTILDSRADCWTLKVLWRLLYNYGCMNNALHTNQIHTNSDRAGSEFYGFFKSHK